jgi:hypothetical protein
MIWRRPVADVDEIRVVLVAGLPFGLEPERHAAAVAPASFVRSFTSTGVSSVFLQDGGHRSGRRTPLSAGVGGTVPVRGAGG